MAAIREGLLLVVPEAILNLLTWQEIEKKICGDPEISVEGLRKSGQPNSCQVWYLVGTLSVNFITL